jgi:hypothetical protein
MSMETALRTRLKNAAGVSTIVGTRIDWTERPQRSAYPAVVLTLVSDVRSQHMAGFDTFRPTRVQIDCFATTAAQKVSLREAVIAAIVPAATQSGVEFLRAQDISVTDRSKNTETGFVHQDLIDLTIWHDG